MHSRDLGTSFRLLYFDKSETQRSLDSSDKTFILNISLNMPALPSMEEQVVFCVIDRPEFQLYSNDPQTDTSFTLSYLARQPPRWPASSVRRSAISKRMDLEFKRKPPAMESQQIRYHLWRTPKPPRASLRLRKKSRTFSMSSTTFPLVYGLHPL